MLEPSFLDKYSSAKADQRIDIILDYYLDFPSIIESQRKILLLRVKSELEYVRQRKNDDMGIVMLLNEISDPTASEAIENVYIEDIVLNGKDVSELMNDMGYSEKKILLRHFDILRKMQEEYAVLQLQLLFLNGNEKKIFELYVQSRHDFHKIAEQEGILQESARRRVWAIRKKIKEKTVNNIPEKI